MRVEQQPLPTGGDRLTLRGIQPSEDLHGASLRIVTDHGSAPEVFAPLVIEGIPPRRVSSSPLSAPVLQMPA